VGVDAGACGRTFEVLVRDDVGEGRQTSGWLREARRDATGRTRRVTVTDDDDDDVLNEYRMEL
jgi:hypothetical protein